MHKRKVNGITKVFWSGPIERIALQLVGVKFDNMFTANSGTIVVSQETISRLKELGHLK